MGVMTRRSTAAPFGRLHTALVAPAPHKRV